MENKENDLLLTMTSNPLFSLGNLKDMGLSVENTSLASRDTYKSLKEIQDLFKKDDGSFNEEKFDLFYDYALAFYNDLANDDFDIATAKQTVFDKYDIYAPEDSKQEMGANLDIIKIFNPDRQRKGTIRLWRTEAPTMSRDEIAQTQKILLNPVASSNGAQEQWGNTPNDSFSFFKDFFKTRVLATWDDDGTHIDPFSGAEISHKKGEFKFNKEGTYYYEDLNGRDVYGKQVLNKLNVITKEGTKINKYDIFDSDDLNQKGPVKTLLKNVALVGSMWIPYVGWGIAAASIGSQLAGVGATFAKMINGVLTNKDNTPILSSIEGWSKSVNRQTARSQYAQENTWCWENFINTIGDVVGQLKEQRFLFEKFPALIKGKDGLNVDKLRQKYIKEQTDLLNTTTKDMLSKNGTEKMKDFARRYSLMRKKGIPQIAEEQLRAYMDSYNNLGRIISQAYMTAITVQDAYGEAKANGAEDWEAALLMLGYTAGEYMIINSELGRWILPETKESNYRNAGILKALSGAKEMSQGTKEERKKIAKYLFDKGVKLAKADYSTGVKTIRASIGSGFAEGLEEVSEELLQDVSYSLLNGLRWLEGKESVMTPWENMTDRYGMSFVGGFFGGGVTNTFTNYKMIKESYNNMTFDKALQELIYMSRNGEINDFIKYVNKTPLAPKNLSATKFKENNDGSILWEPGTAEDNLDKAIKNAILKQIGEIQRIMNANNLNISDTSFLRMLSDPGKVVEGLKLSELASTATSGRFLQEFNTLTQDIIKLTDDINALSLKAQNDQNKTVDPESEEIIKKKKEELKEKLQLKQDLFDGKRSPEFIRDAIVELSPILQMKAVPATFHAYAEKRENMKFDKISKEVLKKLSEEYELYQNSEMKDDVHLLGQLLEDFLHQLTPILLNLSQFYETLTQDPLALKIKETLTLLNKRPMQGTPESLLKNYLLSLDFHNFDIILNLLNILGTEEDKQLVSLTNEAIQTAGEDSNILKSIELEFIENNIEKIGLNIKNLVEPIIKSGYINSEVKSDLIKLLNYIQTNLGTVKESRLYEIVNGDVYNKVNKLFTDYIETIKSYLNILKGDTLKHTPIEDFLNQFSLQITGQPYNIQDVLNKVESLFTDSRKDLTLFNLGELEPAINQGLNLLNFYKMSIEASRTDNGDIDNLFGFSSTLNLVNKEVKTENWEPLAEISGQTANILSQDIDGLLNKLEFAKKLHAINQGLKFSQDERIGLNYNYLTYNKLRALSRVLKSDAWDGLDKLEEALDEATNIALLNPDDLGVSLDIKDLVLRESIKIEDSLYEFFLKNIFDNSISQEKRINKIKEFIKLFEVYSKDGLLLTETMEELDVHSFLNYLMARAAIKSSNFYGMFSEIIRDDVAPMSGLTLVTYLTYASAVNMPVFNDFNQAMKEYIKEDWHNMSEEDRKSKLQKLGKSEIFAQPKFENLIFSLGFTQAFENITLIDGVPGAGKTTAVIKTVGEMLKKYNPELLDKAAVISTENVTNNDTSVKTSDDVHASDSAKQIISKLNLANAEAYTHEGFLKTIISNYKPYKTVRGISEIPNERWKFNEDTWEFDTTDSVVDSSSHPSIMIIDEVSKYNYFLLKAIDNYAKKYGIVVFAAGDFDQSGAIAKHNVTRGGETFTCNEALSRDLFRHVDKLGFTMRSQVNIMSESLLKIQTFLQLGTQGNIPESKFKNDNGEFYGIRVSNSRKVLPGNKINGDIEKEELKKIESDIQLMISKLSENEKIGYVYDHPTNLTNLLKDKYSDKIQFLEGTTVNGLEAKYYIVDLDPEVELEEEGDINLPVYNASAKEKFLSDLYTAISRSQLGVLVIGPEYGETETSTLDLIYGFPELELFNSKPVDNVILETVSPESVKEQSLKKKKQYLAIDFLDKTPFKAIPLRKDNSIPSTKPKKVKELADSTDTGNLNEKILQVNDANNTGSIPVSKVDQDTLNILLFTFNVFSNFGYESDSEGNAKLIDSSLSKYYSKRIDGINGLINNFNDTLKYKEYQDIIGNIQSDIYNISNQTELKNSIISHLNDILPDERKIKDLDIEYGILSGFVLDGTNDRNFNETYLPFDRFKHETAEFLNSGTENENVLPRKSIIIRIGLNGKSLLEIPLMSFENPATLILSKDQDDNYIYEELATEWNNLTGTYLLKLDKFVARFENNPKYKNFVQLFKFFKNTGRNYYKLGDDFIPSDLENFGVQFTSGKGEDNYTVEGYKMAAKKRSLEAFINNINPALNYSDIMINTTYEEIDASGNLLIPKGYPFILVAADKKLDNNTKIVNAYLELLKDPTVKKKVHPFFLVSPQASVDSYIENLRAIFEGDVTNRYEIGNSLTIFKIFRKLLQNEEFRQKYEEANEARFKKVKETIDKLSKKYDKHELTVEELIEETHSWPIIAHNIDKDHSIKDLLQNALFNYIYNSNTKEFFKDRVILIKSILDENDLINYIPRIPKQEELRDKIADHFALLPDAATDGKWKLRVRNGDVGDFLAIGKIDGYVLSMDFGAISEDATKLFSKDTKSDLDFLKHRMKNKKGINKNTKDAIKKFKKISGLTIDTDGKSDIEIHNEILSKINKEDNGIKAMAFKVGNELFICTNEDQIDGNKNIFSGNKVYFKDANGDFTLNDPILIKDASGTANFEIKIDGNVYYMEYNNKTLTIRSALSNNSTVEDNFDNIKQNIINYINQNNDESDALIITSAIELLNNAEDMIDVLKEFEYYPSEIENMLSEDNNKDINNCTGIKFEL